MLNLKTPSTEKMIFDVGHADLYTGKPFQIPYFFENPRKRMMREPVDDSTINFKTWKGEYFQFYLDEYHQNTALVLTSTMLDCAFFSTKRLSIDKMREWAKRRSEKKHPIKNSFSGYFTFGKMLLEQYDTLEEHMREQEVYFSDKVLEDIYKELKRRAK